jgi:hypothetical protein
VGPLTVAAIMIIPLLIITAVMLIALPFFGAAIQAWVDSYNNIFITSLKYNFVFSFILLHIIHFLLSRWPFLRDLLIPFIGAALSMCIYSVFGFGNTEMIFAAVGAMVGSHVFCSVMREADW